MAGRHREPPVPYIVPTDGNEEICGGCRRGGELLCCDACPAAFHALCTGYSCVEEVPETEEWLCWACALKTGKSYLHSQTPLACAVGDQLMVASTSAKAAVWPGKIANPGEVFLRGAVTQVEGDTVHVRYLPPKQGSEQLSASSERLWHGTNNTELCWTEVRGGFAPNARAFAIDTDRVQANHQPGGPGQQLAAAGPSGQHLPSQMLPRTAAPSAPGLPMVQNHAADKANGKPPPPLSIKQRRAATAAKVLANLQAAQRQTSLAEAKLAAAAHAPPPPAGAAEAAALNSRAAASAALLAQQTTAAAAQAVVGGAGRLGLPANAAAAAVTPAAPVSEEEAAFMGSLQRFHTGRGSPLQLPVRLKQRDANLFLMWRQVMACGGFEPVSDAKLWTAIGRGQDVPPDAVMHGLGTATKNIYSKSLKDFEEATREGLTGVPLPPVTKAPPDCSPPRERPALKMPRRKSAPAGKPPAKPEPWMFPPPHAWSHEYKPASDAASLPAAKRRKVECAAAAPRQPAADQSPAGPDAATAAAASASPDAPAAAPLRRDSSARLTAAEEAALLDAGRRGGFTWGSTKPASPAVSPAEKPAAAAAAAAAATFPADPGLLAEELAGPVARSQEADSLAPGDAVEVRSLAVGMRGAWLSATVLQVEAGSAAEGGRAFLVEYRDWVRSQPPAAAAGTDDAAADGAPALAATAAPEGDASLKPGQQPGEKVREWVPLVSRATTKAFPLVRLRRPRGVSLASEAVDLSPGDAVEAWCEGAWVMGRLAGSAEALRVEIGAPPDSEGGTLEVAERGALRRGHPAAASGFGMVAPLESDHMLPRERYRRWLRPRTYRSQGFTFESYACAEELPSHRYSPSAAAGNLLPAASEAPSPTTSAATSAGGGAASGGGRGRKRSRIDIGSGATSQLRPSGSATPGLSRLANASAPGDAAGSPGSSVPSPGSIPAQSPALLATPGTGTLLRKAAATDAVQAARPPPTCGAAAIAAADDEDTDVDIGCDSPLPAASTPLKLEPDARASATAAEAAEAAPRWLGAVSIARHQAAHDAFIASLPPLDAGRFGGGNPQEPASGRAGQRRASGALEARPQQNGAAAAAPSAEARTTRSRSSSRGPSDSRSLSSDINAGQPPATPPPAGLHAATADPVPPDAPPDSPAAAAAADAAADDDSDVWMGATPDVSGDDSDDPEVDMDALRDETESEDEGSDRDLSDEDWDEPQRKRKVGSAGGGSAAKRQKQQQPPPAPPPWVPPPLPPPQPAIGSGKLALY